MNGCYENQCHNESGPVYWNQCNETSEVCENDQCVVWQKVVYSVVIELEEGIDVSELSMSEIRSATSVLAHVEENKVRIRVEVNEKNEIIRIIVTLSDKTTAENIKNIISVEIKEHNQEGFIKHFQGVKVETKEKDILVSRGIMKKDNDYSNCSSHSHFYVTSIPSKKAEFS